MRNMTSQKGFTLLEGVLGMVVLGIISITAVPLLNDANTALSLDAVTKQVEADLTYAQNLATTTGDTYGFEAVSSTSYRVYSKILGVKTTINSPQTHTPLLVDMEEMYPNVIFGAGAFPAFVVEFDGNGAPTTGGNLDILLTANTGAGKTIHVTSTTGNVQIE